MLGLTVCSLLGLIGIAAGDKLHFKEKNLKSIGSQFRKNEAEGWNLLRTARPDETAIFIFGLKQRNVDILEKIFWHVSDPRHSEYGNFISIDQITSLVGLDDDVITTFLMRLSGNFVYQTGNHFSDGSMACQVNKNKDWLTCSIPVRVAMHMFNVPKFHVYSRPASAKRYIRTNFPITIPRQAAEMIDYVGGATGKLPAQNLNLNLDAVEFQDEMRGNFKHIGVYPTVIRERYNITDQVGGKHEANSQCTPQFLEQYYHSRDLNIFWKLYGGGYFHRDDIDKVVGEVGEGISGIEASLDTQYILSTGNNITTWFWYTAGRHEQQEPFLQWLIDLSDTENAPLVNSASYSDKERTVDPDYMTRINTEFMKAGVRGLTLLFASGDDGAGCHNNTHFEPQFPSSSPYITTIGGTAFIKPFGIGEEQGYDISGGGFSNFFEMPDYQKELIAEYFKVADPDKMPPASYYTSTGRGYPDMAAISNHYWVVNNMVPVPGVLGTSASCPVIAGILAHVNDHRLYAGLPPLGFVNPLLYQNPQIMTDVTKGYNAGCDLSNFYDRGFYAEKGWDPVTGLGNPNFPPLVELAIKVATEKRAKL